MKFIAIILLACLSINAFAGIDENEVYCYIKKLGIKSPEIVLKQAIYESGHFKSAICRKKNNIFGFRTVVIYKNFTSWQDCVEYYKRWQDRHYKDSSENYYHFLTRINYSGYKDMSYVTQLRKIRIQASLKCEEEPQAPQQ